MKKTRKNYSPEEKVAILRRHLIDNVPVSDLCEELGLNPNVFYNWQKAFFENGAAPSSAPASQKPIDAIRKSNASKRNWPRKAKSSPN